MAMRIRAPLGFAMLATGLAAWPVLAQDLTPDVPASVFDLVSTLRHHELFAAVVALGPILFAATAAILYVRIRAKVSRESRALRSEIERLRGELDRSELLRQADPQIICIYDGDKAVSVSGTLAGFPLSQAGMQPFALASLVDRPDLPLVEQAIGLLRDRGQPFQSVVRSAKGGFLEIDGRAVGGKVAVRFRDVTGDRRALAEAGERYRKLSEEIATMRSLLDEAPLPFWLRDPSEKLIWVNKAYAKAVEAQDEATAVATGIELLDRQRREEAMALRQAGKPYLKRVPAVVGDARRMLDVVDIPSGRGSAGFAVDVSELESVRADLGRQMEAHRRTLDELATAVAIFDGERRLAFHNAAFRDLWQLDIGFLEDRPADGEILDRLRTERKLEEQADFRVWKSRLHEAYRALQPQQHWWHLPGGQTLRVIVSPNPAGGVTYLYEDVSERIDLETRFNAMARMQGETLDALREGVVVFGSDGRIRLANPAFAKIWQLPGDWLAERPHIDDIVARCSVYFADDSAWHGFKASVTSLGDMRQPLESRMTRADATVIDTVTVPLPDGGTLATFTDVTHSVTYEKALERTNLALNDAARVKNDFVHHISYELRSPLTSIIGFAQLLDGGLAGTLTEKQRQYTGYIMTSTDSLLAIINNILDLATIDAGVMVLDLGEIDIRKTMEATAEGVRHRLAASGVRLEMRAKPVIGSFRGDEKRVRQILFNLLTNAIGFSNRGSLVTLEADRNAKEVTFRVEDRGRGIPPAVKDRLFERFETNPGGTEHRGAGLGLSIVRSLIALHGGTVDIASEEGKGTIVTCRFPLEAVSREAVA